MDTFGQTKCSKVGPKIRGQGLRQKIVLDIHLIGYSRGGCKFSRGWLSLPRFPV